MTFTAFTKLRDKRSQQSQEIALVGFLRVEVIAYDNFRLVSGTIDLLDSRRAKNSLSRPYFATNQQRSTFLLFPPSECLALDNPLPSSRMRSFMNGEGPEE